MKMLRERLWGLAALVVGLALASSAAAQTYTLTAGDAGVGTVTSATSGDTTFRISSSVSGSVSRAPGGGTGSLLSAGSGRATVSIRCQGGQCNSNSITMTVSAAGSTTGRAGAPHSFTVSDGTADASGGGGTWTIVGISNGQTRTVYLGMDLPIADANSAQPTGAASAGYVVHVHRSNDPSRSATDAGTVTATVIRPLAIQNLSALTFGKIIKGAGTVTINQDTGARSVAAGYFVASSTTSRAAFKVTGEAGRQVSISAPSSVAMAGPQALSISLFKNFGTSLSLQQVQGGPSGAGEYTLGVGGQVQVTPTTKSGAYTGSFIVQVNYQ